MSLTWAVGAAAIVGCWVLGTLLTIAARRRAAILFAGESPAFAPTARAQLAGTALNRVLPANAGVVAMHLQLLRRHGLPATAFTGALLGYGASSLLANLAAGAAVGILLASDLVAGSWQLSLPVPGWSPLIALLGLPALMAPAVRRVVGSGLRHLRDASRLTVARPGAIAGLALFEVGTLAALGVGLYTALNVSGSSLSLPLAICVVVICNVSAGAVPAPAGAGPVDLALVGVLTAFGVAGEAAVTAVALYRLVTHWLPVPLGLIALGLTPRRPARSAADEPAS